MISRITAAAKALFALFGRAPSRRTDVHTGNWTGEHGKHLPFFKLTDACTSTECPLCTLRRRALDRYMESLVYEGINDRGFRRSFNRSRGFCALHEHAFLAAGDRLAVVITHRQLMVAALQEIRGHGRTRARTQSGGSGERGNRHGSPRGGDCQVCVMLEQTERQYLSTFAAHRNDPELQRYFVPSAGLCLPHFRRLVAEYPPVPDWLLQLQETRFREARDAADEYIASSNFTLSGKSTTLSAPHLRALPERLVGLAAGYHPHHASEGR